MTWVELWGYEVFYEIKSNLFVVVVAIVVAVVVVSVPPHFEIPRKIIQKKFEKRQFGKNRGVLMCCIYI
jgi:hypothetical protein